MIMWSHRDVVEARRLIAPHITETPLLWSERMSRPGAGVYIKAEALQRTGSFKVRGALNAVGRLDEKARARGVVTASTGSHGKGVAYAARALGVSAVVVLPENPVEVKRKAIEEYGARTVEYPGTSVDRIRYARALAEAEGRTFIHSFDAPGVFLGQGTVGLEIMEQLPEIDTVVVPIGGGGLIAGISIAIKEASPRTRIIGVQPAGCAAMYHSLKRGEIVAIESCRTIAEGLSSSKPEPNTFSVVQRYVDDVVLVTDEEIKAAARRLLLDERILVEASGAAATAAFLFGKFPLRNGNTVLVASGGNTDAAFVRELLAPTGPS